MASSVWAQLLSAASVGPTIDDVALAERKPSECGDLSPLLDQTVLA